MSPLPSAPRTQLNGRVPSRRAIALGSVPLDAVKRVKNAYAATVNHVVLAACAGALRRYLGAHGEIPRQPLVAGVPVALGERAPDGLGNSLSVMLVRRPRLADPLSGCARRAGQPRGRARTKRSETSSAVGRPVPNRALHGVSLSRLGLGEPPAASTSHAEHAGTDMPLYRAGARQRCHPIGQIYDGVRSISP
jgi:hypothetical protein